MTAPSTLTVARSDAGYVVFLEGRATMNEGPAFHTFVTQLLDHAEEPALVVCADGCEYMDSTFLGGLISLHKKVFSDGAAAIYRGRIARIPQPVTGVGAIGFDSQTDRPRTGMFRKPLANPHASGQFTRLYPARH